MATQAITPPPHHPSGNFWAETREFSEKHADLESGWRNFQNRQRILGKLAGREFWGKLVDFP
jgi:hypothetical protein